MTRATLAAVLVVLAAAVSACGDDGGSGAPTDASVEEFCEAHRDKFLPEVDMVHDWGEEAAAVGTPEGIPDDARAGFKIVVDQALAMTGPDDTDDEGPYEGVEAPAEVYAFSAYVDETCGGVDDLGLPEVPSLPTE